MEHARRPEAVKHRDFTDGARPETRAHPIARGGVDRYAENGDVCAVEPVPIGACRLASEGCQTDEGQVHPVGRVAAGVIGCYCNIPSFADRGDMAPRFGLFAVQQILSVSLASEIALRTNPSPWTLRIIGASSDPSTLRRSRPM